MVFSVVNYKRGSFAQLNKRTDVLSHLDRTWTDFKLISNLEVFLCLCRKKLIGLEHFNNRLSIDAAISKHDFFFYLAIGPHILLGSKNFFAPLASALIFELMYWQGIVQLMGQHKHGSNLRGL